MSGPPPFTPQRGGWRDRLYAVVPDDIPMSFAPYDYRITYELIAPPGRRLTPRERRQVKRWLRQQVDRIAKRMYTRYPF